MTCAQFSKPYVPLTFFNNIFYNKTSKEKQHICNSNVSSSINQSKYIFNDFQQSIMNNK